jgi:NAD(P)H dehydrogenase (quinone)
VTTDTTPSIAVTGATGVVGRGVARGLAALGVPQRLVVRQPARVQRVAGATVVKAAYADRAAAEEALAGTDTVFMVSGSEDPNRLADHLTFVDAAAAAGVRRIVYTSFYGAAADSTFLLARDHWHTEQHIRESGLAFTFLRDNIYADLMPDMAGPEGVLRGPAGQGRLAPVARADVIDVAVKVLAAAAAAREEPTIHDGIGYSLTGPHSLTLDEVAAIITGATGRQVRYQDETIDEAYASRAGYGAPAWQVDAWVSTYTAIAAGELSEVTDDVEGVTGHPPISLRALLGG